MNAELITHKPMTSATIRHLLHDRICQIQLEIFDRNDVIEAIEDEQGDDNIAALVEERIAVRALDSQRAALVEIWELASGKIW